MIKKALVLLFLTSPLFAEGTNQPQVIGPFSGLNDADNSAVIPADHAQDLLNVDVTLGGRSVKKRKGFGAAFATTYTTSPIHGTYEFYDASGNTVDLVFNDVDISVSIGGASLTVLNSSAATAGATFQCVDTQGIAYCANTTRNRIVKIVNGTSFLPLSTLVSTGTMVAMMPDRLVEAGFSEAPNRIDFSAAADFTTWTTGVSPTSAFNFTITSPGSGIKHITYAFNRLMWFKDQSFGYILPGITASDWVVKTVSPNIGTLDNSSIYDKGILYFRGQDGHIYAFDGSNLIKLSRDIGGSIASTQNKLPNSWTQTTASDFSGGFAFATDTTTTGGQVHLNYFQDLFSSSAAWSGNSAWSPIGGKIYPSTSNTSTFYYDLSTSPLTIADRFYVSTNVDFVRAYSTHQYTCDVGVLDASVNGNGYSAAISVRTSVASSSSTLSIRKWTGLAVAGDISSTTIAGLSSGTAHNLMLYASATGYLQLYLDGTLYLSTTPANAYSSLKYGLIATGNVGSGAGDSSAPLRSYARFDDYKIRASTGSFYSAVKNASLLTSWDSFQATKVTNSGTVSFFIRASTNSIVVNSSTPTWTSLNSGDIPTISTGSYFQIRTDFSVTNSTYDPYLDSFTQNWFEGSASDKCYMAYFNDAEWISIAYGAGQTTNNRILRYDLINSDMNSARNVWTVYDIPSNGFYVRNNSLYFGSSSSGNVYKFGDVDNDNGSAINAYWQSKDFFNSSPFTNDDMTDLSLFFSAVSNSSMTVTYTLNGNSSTSYTVPTGRTTSSFGIDNRNLPLGTSGNTFSLKFGNNAADQSFEVFSAQYGVVPKSWKPGSQ